MDRKIINGLKYWGQLLLLPVYWLSFLVPRDRKIWLFGSTFGRRFADNPRYLYLYVHQHREELKVRPIWISHDKKLVRFLNQNDYEAYYYHSLKGIWYALRGKVYLFDNYSKDINFWQSGGAVKVNLWHGIPLKKIQADNIFDKVRHPKNAWEKFKCFPRRLSDEKPFHYVLTTSEFMRPIFESAFQTKNVIVAGYPRNDAITSEAVGNLYLPLEIPCVAQIKKKKASGLKMLYYMPTFRDSETKFFDVVNIQILQEYLEKESLLLCIKLHPKSKLKKAFEEIKSEHILIIPQETDPYVFIPESDALITDYSSIYFDYLLTGKPIFFFCYDLEEYLSDSREMYFEYETFTPGVKVKTQEELQKAIGEVIGEKGCDSGQVKEVRNEVTDDGFGNQIREDVSKKVFDNRDKLASELLVRRLKTLLG